MNYRHYYYLGLSRYITYIGVFIVSIIMMGHELNRIALFSFLFLLVLLNSSARINRHPHKPLWFMGSILAEILVVSYMQNNFNSIAFVYLYIATVDVYLMLRLSYMTIRLAPKALRPLAWGDFISWKQRCLLLRNRTK